MLRLPKISESSIEDGFGLNPITHQTIEFLTHTGVPKPGVFWVLTPPHSEYFRHRWAHTLSNSFLIRSRCLANIAYCILTAK